MVVAATLVCFKAPPLCVFEKSWALFKTKLWNNFCEKAFFGG